MYQRKSVSRKAGKRQVLMGSVEGDGEAGSRDERSGQS